MPREDEIYSPKDSNDLVRQYAASPDSRLPLRQEIFYIKVVALLPSPQYCFIIFNNITITRFEQAGSHSDRA